MAPHGIPSPARFLCAAFVGVALVAACGGGPETSTAESGTSPGCVSAFDAQRDYFPDKTSFEDATNVTVSYHRSYKVVRVKQPGPGEPPQTSVLVQCGAPTPPLVGELAGATAVRIPVARVAAASTTQVPAYELLDRVDALAGVGLPQAVSPGKARDAIAAGRVKGFKGDGMSVQVEEVAGVRPDLFVASGPREPGTAKIAELGIPVVSNAEWLETTALGRAEWTKFTAVFLNEERTANHLYSSMRSRYRAVAAKAAQVRTRPTVIVGTLSKGAWTAPAANSYLAREIADAGGDYVLRPIATSPGKALSLEEVLARGATAEFWLAASRSTRWPSLAQPVRDDPRLGSVRAVTQGNVWNYTKALNATGGNDYWQSGVVRPDVVLADLVAILHPELMPQHTFTYYERVPRP